MVIDRLTSQHTRAALGGIPDGVTGYWLGCEKSQGKIVPGETYGRPPPWTHYYLSGLRHGWSTDLAQTERSSFRPLLVSQSVKACPIRRVSPATAPDTSKCSRLFSLLLPPVQNVRINPSPRQGDRQAILSTRARSREHFINPVAVRTGASWPASDRTAGGDALPLTFFPLLP